MAVPFRSRGLYLFICLILTVQINVFHVLYSLSHLKQTNAELQLNVRELQNKLRQDSIGSSSDESTARNKLRQLELRLNSWMNWNSDPYLGSNMDASLCQNKTRMFEYGCPANHSNNCAGLFDHPICLDEFLPKAGKCIVYDFGIRANPEFGATLLGPPFHCQVFAFDPSPITKEWYTSTEAKELRQNPNYTLFHFGAGGVNGEVTLNEYDWGQVSILRNPRTIKRNCNDDPKALHCQVNKDTVTRKSFQLPVRTLGSIMKELGHTHIDMLKIDVEGSEYMFLEEALDEGTMRKVDQMTIEWHHFDFDSRYGGGSSPAINAIVAMLEQQGLRQFSIHNDAGGWPTNVRGYFDMGMQLRYNLASFVRVKKT